MSIAIGNKKNCPVHNAQDIFHKYYKLASDNRKKYHYSTQKMLNFFDEWELLTEQIKHNAHKHKIDLSNIPITTVNEERFKVEWLAITSFILTFEK